MSKRRRLKPLGAAAKGAIAGAGIVAGAFCGSFPAGAEPVPGPPPVPPIPNPVYGPGATDQFGPIGDLFSSIRTDDPLGALTVPPVPSPGAPPGAGASPPLPPGTVSLTAPESSTAPVDGVWLGPLPGMAPVPLAPPVPPAAP
ncbi:MAG: hypothetical protein ABWY45_11070 [Mycobacterium sp.]